MIGVIHYLIFMMMRMSISFLFIMVKDMMIYL